MRWLEAAVLGSGAVSTGVMAGVYFTFSAFVMRSLDALEHPGGAAAMRAINRVILSSPFMPLFFGTTLASVGLAGWGLSRWGQPGSWVLILGGLTYIFGMFVITAACNVPLNDQLDRLDPSSIEAQVFWQEYQRKWTVWNHVRTAASTLACGLFVVAGLKIL